MPKNAKGELIFVGGIILYILIYYFTDITPFHSDTHIKSYVLLIMGVLLLLSVVQIIVSVKDKESRKSLRFEVSEAVTFFKGPLLYLVIWSVVYLALIPVVGFFTISFIYIDGVLWFLKIRKKLTLLLLCSKLALIILFRLELHVNKYRLRCKQHLSRRLLHLKSLLMVPLVKTCT